MEKDIFRGVLSVADYSYGNFHLEYDSGNRGIMLARKERITCRSVRQGRPCVVNGVERRHLNDGQCQSHFLCIKITTSASGTWRKICCKEGF